MGPLSFSSLRDTWKTSARLHLTVEACAALLGVSPFIIQKWESGSLAPIRLTHLHALAALKTTDIDDVGARLEKLDPEAAKSFRRARRQVDRFSFATPAALSPAGAGTSDVPLATTGAAASGDAAQASEPVAPPPDLAGRDNGKS